MKCSLTERAVEMASSSALAMGLMTKSCAPRRIASTARSTVPCPVIMMTWVSGQLRLTSARQCHAAHPGHHEIGEDGVYRAGAKRSRPARRCPQAIPCVRLREVYIERDPDGALIIDDEDVCHWTLSYVDRVGHHCPHRSSPIACICRSISISGIVRERGFMP